MCWLASLCEGAIDVGSNVGSRGMHNGTLTDQGLWNLIYLGTPDDLSCASRYMSGEEVFTIVTVHSARTHSTHANITYRHDPEILYDRQSSQSIGVY